MFRRTDDTRIGAHIVRGLEPMAARLELDLDDALTSAPTTTERRTFDAYRCGQSLLFTFTYPEAWPRLSGSERQSRKLARQASKIVYDSLITDQGASAVAHMAHGYGHETAKFWRRAAETQTGMMEALHLRMSANESEALADLATTHWPVTDPHGAAELITLSEKQRVTDLDNPNAKVDLRLYFGQARAACGAAALALGAELPKYEALIYKPIASLDLRFTKGLEYYWLIQGHIWRNLLSKTPQPYAHFMQAQPQR